MPPAVFVLALVLAIAWAAGELVNIVPNDLPLWAKWIGWAAGILTPVLLYLLLRRDARRSSALAEERRRDEREDDLFRPR